MKLNGKTDQGDNILTVSNLELDIIKRALEEFRFITGSTVQRGKVTKMMEDLTNKG